MGPRRFIAPGSCLFSASLLLALLLSPRTISALGTVSPRDCQPSGLSALRFPSYLGPAAPPAAICMSTHRACWYPHRFVTSVCLQHAVSKAPRFSHSSGVTPHSSRLSLVPISKRNRKTPVLNLLLPSASHCSAKLWGMGRPMGGLWTAKR